MALSTPTIQLGDYIVIQRQKYTKLHRFGSLDTRTMLGKEQLELRAIHGQPYDATFKMCPKEGQQRRGPRLNTLQLCSETEMHDIRDALGISSSGNDNRDIIDTGDSQGLRPQDIEQLKEDCVESKKIIEKIIENSKTFHAKTEYAQEKYLKKKEKKYFEYVQIRKPSIRLIAQIYYRQDADKIMGLRMDTLSQLLCYADVCAFGNYLLYESGSNGLLPASFLNAMGPGTEARLVHMHPGNVPQKQAIVALNFPAEQMHRCISVNIYSVLRQYYQGSNKASSTDTNAELETTENCKETTTLENNATIKETRKKPVVPEITELCEDTSIQLEGNALTNCRENSLETEIIEPCAKKLKLEEDDDDSIMLERSIDDLEKPAEAVKKWRLENERACERMRAQFDSLVIAAKEHPSNIVKALLPFVKPSRPIVIFSWCKELLMELYVELKASTEVTNLHLTSNWMRMYQIMPNRTHPEVNMSGNSGYMLTGFTIR